MDLAATTRGFALEKSAKTRGFDPKPLKNAGFGPLATDFRIKPPLGIKYTYDI